MMQLEINKLKSNKELKKFEYNASKCRNHSEEQMDLNVVKPGTTVTILDLSLDDPEEEKYTIVGSFETDPVNGKIQMNHHLLKHLLVMELMKSSLDQRANECTAYKQADRR